ncbi:DnaJ homolog subfamily C member 13 [Geodia barretti]|uniref:DnaJ homolog subfamily C member 13 n=1 Tax=Geodia barretti TaxID=519541 RepID=A0AA35X4J8_GEOBA|nr:DnaJ homolog subfamily C member 13 [Geodia barretti]
MYRYKRVFSIGTKAITTYNPNTHEVTNQWCYNEFVGIAPSPKASNEFIITMKKGRKTQQMTYSTEFRPEVLTRTLMFSPLFCEKPRNETDKRFDAAKFHWDEAKVKVLLVVRRYGVSQVDITGHTLTDYKYKDIEYMAKVADHPGAFVVAAGGFGRLQLGTGALVVSSIIDFFTFAVCPPYSETTEAEKFDMVLELISGLGRTVFKLFQHPSLAIVKAAGLIMKAIIEEGTPEMAKKMQDLALAEGALPRHLHTSLFTASSDNRLLTHRSEVNS